MRHTRVCAGILDCQFQWEIRFQQITWEQLVQSECIQMRPPWNLNSRNGFLILGTGFWGRREKVRKWKEIARASRKEKEEGEISSFYLSFPFTLGLLLDILNLILFGSFSSFLCQWKWGGGQFTVPEKIFLRRLRLRGSFALWIILSWKMAELNVNMLGGVR